jgi:hypothetical protein
MGRARAPPRERVRGQMQALNDVTAIGAGGYQPPGDSAWRAAPPGDGACNLR